MTLSASRGCTRTASRAGLRRRNRPPGGPARRRGRAAEAGATGGRLPGPPHPGETGGRDRPCGGAGTRAATRPARGRLRRRPGARSSAGTDPRARARGRGRGPGVRGRGTGERRAADGALPAVSVATRRLWDRRRRGIRGRHADGGGRRPGQRGHRVGRGRSERRSRPLGRAARSSRCPPLRVRSGWILARGHRRVVPGNRARLSVDASTDAVVDVYRRASER